MYLDDAVTSISGFEGRIHWMYLDTRGNVTVAVGKMLPDAQAAIQYPFRRQTAELAETNEIVEEFALVKAMRPGLVAGAYRRLASLLLDDTAIDQILRLTIGESVSELERVFPQFLGFPDQAKVGLLDMHYNLGLPHLIREFPDFCTAVKGKRWLLAGRFCHRAGINIERNDWTRKQFVTCAQAA